MDDKEFGKKLRDLRISANKSVPEVSEYLKSIGYKAATQTIYGWERGHSQPTTDTFMAMCSFYGLQEILPFFGYKEPPSATDAAPGEDRITMEESNRLLVALGLIEEGQGLSDDDLAFLRNIIALLEAWFRKGNSK